MLLFLKQIIQIAQYNTTNIVSTIRYMANASSDHHPNHVPGMLIIIKPKQPNLPICSATSINLLLHLFSKPSLHLIAKIILGIIMTAIIISPNIFNQSIYSSANSDFARSRRVGKPESLFPPPQHFIVRFAGGVARFGKPEVSDFFFRYSLSLGFPHDRNNPRSPDVPAGLCHKAFHYPQRDNHTS